MTTDVANTNNGTSSGADVAAELAKIAAEPDNTDNNQVPPDAVLGSSAGEDEPADKTSAGDKQDTDKSDDTDTGGDKDGSASAGDDDSIEAILKDAGIEPTSDDRPMPGKSAEEIQAEQEAEAWKEFPLWQPENYLKNNQEGFMQRLEGLGVSRADADALWQDIAKDYKAMSAVQSTVRQTLWKTVSKLDALKEKDPEAYELFSTQEFSNPLETMGGAFAAGRKAELARLQKAGEHFPRKELEKVVTATQQRTLKEVAKRAPHLVNVDSKTGHASWKANGNRVNGSGAPVSTSELPRNQDGTIDSETALSHIASTPL